MMKMYKIAALMYADFILFRNSKWKLVEYIYFPITTIIIWGLFSIFVKSYAVEAGLIVLTVNILWNFAYLAQSHVDMQMNEDSWSGSLKQIIITGVSDFEYVTARIFSAIILSSCIMLLMIALSITVFNLSILVTQWQLFTILIITTLIASIGLSVMVAGAMIALGKEYGFLAWTILQIFILLSAPFYPVDVFPEILRPLVYAMPYTHIFEATRGVIQNNLNYANVASGFYIAAAYLIISLPFYRYIFKKAREKGWLVRLS